MSSDLCMSLHVLALGHSFVYQDGTVGNQLTNMKDQLTWHSREIFGVIKYKEFQVLVVNLIMVFCLAWPQERTG